MAEMPDLVAYQKRMEAKKEKAKDERIKMPDLVAYQKRQEEAQIMKDFLALYQAAQLTSAPPAQQPERSAAKEYTRAQKADLWTIINKSWKKNPYD